MKFRQSGLPHTYPFLFIDRVVSINRNSDILCEKVVTGSEFPDNINLPRVLLVEAMAQASGILIMESEERGNTGKMGYLNTITGMVFRSDVSGGDLLIIGSQIQIKMLPHCAFRVFVKKENRVVAEGELTLTIL